jgi:hypothetical protein
MAPLPALPEDWEPTRATLHAYAHAVGSIPRAHGITHPKWWHISLKVRPTGLVTDPIPLPGGDTLQARMDLRHHEIVVETSTAHSESFSMTEGMTGTEMGDALIAAAAELGLGGEYNRDKFEDSEPRVYDGDHALTYFRAVSIAERTFEIHRASLIGLVGPIQLWPHNFDLAFEWFGTRTVRYEEDGETTEHPSQINVGFYPRGRAYFYSNPWPFEKEKLTGQPLPHGAEWHLEGWEGTILYYDQVAGDPDGPQRVLEYARAVHEVASPTLMA